MGTFNILHGDVIEWLNLFPADHFDACFCDPPYFLQFMGKEFDKQHKKMQGANEGQKMQAWHEGWTREVLRVLKPGGHMLAFGGTRTYHRLVCAAEDVGFEVRDTMVWLHGQGFPKGKSQLKPAHEPILLAKKYGANGHLALDACRISTTEKLQGSTVRNDIRGGHFGAGHRSNPGDIADYQQHEGGRWPANLILSHHEDCTYTGTRRVNANQSSKPGSGKGHRETQGNGIYRGVGGVVKTSTADADGMEMVEVWECHPDCPVRMLDEQSGVTKSGVQTRPNPRSGGGLFKTKRGEAPEGPQYGDRGGASRFFYCSKVSPRERNLGGIDCRHPTLKPISLTTYLSRLLLPPPHPDLTPRRLLIPFSGAGSEIAGALLAGWDDITGIEQDAESITWAEARIPAALESLSHLSRA